MFWTMLKATATKVNKRPWLHNRDKSKDAEKRK